jgi:hypothetical protein
VIPLEPHGDPASHCAADTAQLVQQIADNVQVLAARAGGRPGIGDLAAAVEAVAAQSRVTAHIIEACCVRAHAHRLAERCAQLENQELKLAVDNLSMLGSALRSAVCIYSLVCRELADHEARAEEHDLARSSAAAPLSAATLTRRAKSLAAVARRA